MNAATRMFMVLSLATLFTLAAGIPLYAQNDQAFITYRQKVMSSNGDNMAAIGEIMKSSLPMGKNIVTHAANIEQTMLLAASAFEKNISAGATDSKPEIWADWKKFVSLAEAAADKASTLSKVAMSGDMAAVGPAVKALGGACGDCHKEFRKPKEESYKNK
ncbi:MAG: cytochrome c [Candidatus Lambdaproteobacteria bacterium]|nr:cytochrome c [Candidatus Lambdaproteobacteria bacterium]